LFLYGKIYELGSQGRGPLAPWVYHGPGIGHGGELIETHPAWRCGTPAIASGHWGGRGRSGDLGGALTGVEEAARKWCDNGEGRW
jgi:hypothetical protein